MQAHFFLFLILVGMVSQSLGKVVRADEPNAVLDAQDLALLEKYQGTWINRTPDKEDLKLIEQKRAHAPRVGEISDINLQATPIVLSDSHR